MKLTVLNQEWENEDQFPEECDFKNKQVFSFTKYTDVADFLDEHLEFKNKVMLVKSPNQVFGKKVIFDGSDCFIEGRGHV